MPIVKYIAVHSSPLSMLKYITREDKKEKAIVSGVNCSADAGTAYEELKIGFERFSGLRFYKRSLNRKNGIPEKEPVRLHHYIQSFAPGEVTAEEAHKIGMEWAEKMFGRNRSVVIATHCEKGHIHNHFAVAVYDDDGRRWYGDKETLKKCRAVSDRIAKAHGLSVIENPKYRPNRKYNEYRARKEGISWKQKLCDDIDGIILKENVRNIDDLICELRAKGYGVTYGKYISVRVRPDRKAIRSFRLGDGYSLEHLQYRIANKNMEMPLSEVMKFEGIQREYALCIRQLQIEIYRKPERDRLHLATYREVERTLKLLNFISKEKITSVKSFEMKVAEARQNVDSLKNKKEEILKKLEAEEKIISDFPKFLEIRDKRPNRAQDIRELEYNLVENAGVSSPDDIKVHEQKAEALKVQLTELDEKIKTASAEKNSVCDFYKIYSEQMRSDYSILLERARNEIENRQREEEREKAEPKEEMNENARGGNSVRRTVR